jgi:2-amino-4-hydroxy-6-hydroxymethyldihydropteridine diphosphokinase
VGLGSNLGDSMTQLRKAIDALRALPGTQVQRCSSFYCTAPVGRVDQPDFINAVCCLATELTAGKLMCALLELERNFGRVRGAEKGGPRTLDLDLLLYSDDTVASELLTLPHPRLHERAFVLEPLCEIAPSLVVPGRGPVTALRAQCAAQRIRRLA